MTIKHAVVLLMPIFLFASCVVATGAPSPFYYQPVYYGPGIGLGTIIAVIVSWQRNRSILLAILCGLLGWIYVIYALIFPKR